MFCVKAHAAPEIAHIDTVTAQKASVTAGINVSTDYIEALTANIENVSSYKMPMIAHIKAMLNPLSNLQ